MVKVTEEWFSEAMARYREARAARGGRPARRNFHSPANPRDVMLRRTRRAILKRAHILNRKDFVR